MKPSRPHLTLPIESVARAGAAIGVPAGLPRIGTSFGQSSDPTPALLAIYFVIDLACCSPSPERS